MTAQVLTYDSLSKADRMQTALLGTLMADDQIELRVKHQDGAQTTQILPPTVAKMVERLLNSLMRGERVAILTEDQELSPNDAARILGISRPLVVHRMEIGDLPFRHVGAHRRAALRDVLALKVKLDGQRAAMEALAEDAEDLNQRYGV